MCGPVAVGFLGVREYCQEGGGFVVMSSGSGESMLAVVVQCRRGAAYVPLNSKSCSRGKYPEARNEVISHP